MRQNLLFLPGLLCDERLWRDQIGAMGDVAHATVADLTRDDNMDALAARALDSVSGRFALCALSMGGYVAMAILRLAPRRVTRLCLMDTSARPDTASQVQQRQSLMKAAAGNRFRGVTPRLLPSLLHPDRVSDVALGAEVMAMAERVGRDAFLRQQTAILGRPDSRPDLPGLRMPTLVAVGAGDQLTPPEMAREMAGLIPGANLAVIEDAGHLPPLEQPEVVTSLLRDWLAAEPNCG
jgi:pimeloyl-ACP methyl ester carboxylesterase